MEEAEAEVLPQLQITVEMVEIIVEAQVEQEEMVLMETAETAEMEGTMEQQQQQAQHLAAAAAAEETDKALLLMERMARSLSHGPD
jgi:hypothetical protein